MQYVAAFLVCLNKLTVFSNALGVILNFRLKGYLTVNLLPNISLT